MIEPLYTPLPIHICAALQQEATRLLNEADFSPTSPLIIVDHVTDLDVGSAKQRGIRSASLCKSDFTAEQVRNAIQAVIVDAIQSARDEDARAVERHGGPVVREQYPKSLSIALLDQPPYWDENLQEMIGDGTTFHFALNLTFRWKKASTP